MTRLLTCILPLALCSGALAGVSLDQNGWTVVTPSQDTRFVYVSSSQGNNNNNGLTPQTPKQTIAAANSLIRDGYPDHLLLKRGDTFNVSGSDLGRWKNGRSAQEPLLMTGYGEGARPILHLTGSAIHHAGQERDYQFFIGIDFYRPYSDPDSHLYDGTESSTALDFTGGGDNILIEDCRFRFVGIVAQTYQTNICSNFTFRRNIVTDNWCYDSYTTDDHVNGLYLSGVDGYTIEENFFDHCGWNEEISGAGANMYAHNMYIQYSNKAGGIMRGNISTRGAAHGLQARAGGVVERNLFALNAIGFNIGGVDDPTDPNVYSFDNRAVQNVVIEGRLMDPNNTNWPRTPAVWGFAGAFVGDIDLTDNIMANRIHSGVNEAITEREEPVTIHVQNTIVYNWDSDWDDTTTNFPDPDRNLGDYYQSIGGTNSTEAYLQWQRNRPEGSFPWSMTSYAAINYIRAGFNKSPVSGYYQYDGSSSVAVTGVSLSPSSVSLQVNQTQQLTATVSPSNATNTAVTWGSSNTSVVTVSSSGLVTAVGAGSATITVTTVDGSYTDTTSVSVSGGQSGGNGSNIALGASVTVSSDDGNVGANLVDDDLDGESRWSAFEFPQWAEIDLGATFAVEEIRVHPYQNRAYQYEIEASIDGVNYGTIVDRTSNTTGGSVISDVISPVSARYIRITVTGASGYTGAWASLREVEVIGSSLAAQNVALGASVTASAFQNDSVGYQPPSLLVDGDTDNESRWSAFGFPQWAIIDLGSTFAVGEIRVHPSGNRAYQYEVEASVNGSSYTTIVDRTSNTTGGDTITDSFSTTSARYIRITVTGASGYTGNWISLTEVEVMSAGSN